ncbi:2-C-methyl-D-erythritol 4-phosphate cytidylyltransferase [Thalassotalea sp. LPB0316]|uniref:2-C-methyl-D-erythritol 4-phosphate cytidylyltransferase n=1 Tax=Thalassotalea sp. LPB0316 TaxID=2769490 RepID=UPI001868A723|nr:2-C-methyl-D-erythritol 4-phosphate cytidylyltransferase [Thalassotalea sp. LPB0316]QOL25804.1 2-C-methyl-D-erythritol 4-phosphate cytidylyltransferase [Thalassotalea sp. LPB0316]
MNKQESPNLAVVVPAAGVGKRMQSACPKQYLTINHKTVLEHTVERLLSHQSIDKVIIALGENDGYFADTSLVNHPNVETVIGGQERVDSVLAGLYRVQAIGYDWVLVHDAARPCVKTSDIDQLINHCLSANQGGLLAYPAKDTIKRSSSDGSVAETVERSVLWHALTPQMYPTVKLIDAIVAGLAQNKVITDESSAMELANEPSQLIEGASDNIKITRPEDLALAKFILSNQQLSNQETICE